MSVKDVRPLAGVCLFQVPEPHLVVMMASYGLFRLGTPSILQHWRTHLFNDAQYMNMLSLNFPRISATHLTKDFNRNHTALAAYCCKATWRLYLDAFLR